jgi:hypothetical protein
MNFDLSKIEFNKNDIKNNTKLPKKLDKKLAHLIGIHLGDGHLTKAPKNYGIAYDGHYTNEYKWYHNFLAPSIYNLFNRKATPIKGHNTIRILFASKAIHTFLNKICGLPLGTKKDCDIPFIIKEADLKFKGAFLRGLADTDFSLVFKNRHKDINYYPVIDHNTSNNILSRSIIHMLSDMGINVHSGSRIVKRYDKSHKSYYIQINGIKRLKKWMDKIGFTSYNQLTKLEVWKNFGFLPPGTNITDRLNILNRKKDINFYKK